MRTVLILSKLRAFPAAVAAAADFSKFQLIVKEDLRSAESLLTRGAIDAIILDLELTDVNAVRMIEQVRQAAPDAPLIVVSTEKHWEWEEDAFLLGVSHVVTKPIRAKLLNHLLTRIFQNLPDSQAADPAPGLQSSGHRSNSGAAAHFNALEALRKFSSVLTHSLEPQALLREFLLVLREVLGVNRAVIFLRNPTSLFGNQQAPEQEDRWLRSACAIGLEQSFLDHFALSLAGGLGAYLRKHGRILKSTSPDVLGSREMTREFQLVGGSVAIPILDRETLLGVAVLDERLTGDPYENDELSLLFHMLEEVALAIRNSWLHDQLQTSHSMLTDILANLGTACVVIGNNLAVLHSNTEARRVLLAENPDKSQLEFSDLPQELGSKVFTVMKTNIPVPSFKYQFAALPDQSYLVAISPFQTQKAASADAALLIVENITSLERAKRLEVEASSLRLITTMAEHLAHEIGNSVVPLSTHQQLLVTGIDDEEFRVSLAAALGAGVKRITRLANQMMFLARGKTDFGDQIRVNELIDEAFREAYVYHNGKVPDFHLAEGIEKLTIAGDHKALRHAFSEVLLNALQASPGESKKIAVSVSSSGANGKRGVNVEIRDGGTGFTPETARRAPEPFFSTRNVGLGLGLTVTRKIIEDHKGRVEIEDPTAKGSGVVKITLPLSDQN